MKKHQKVFELVKYTYENSQQPFAKWMWKNHVPLVAQKTEELSQQFHADGDLAIAGAWLHDFGDAFVHRHSDEHDEISRLQAIKVLEESGYTVTEIDKILKEVIGPHSCKEGLLPDIVEGKVVATADALAHLTTDFYVQFAWMHLPDGLSYKEYLNWVKEKIDRDFNDKIFFQEIKEKFRYRYEALKEVFVK